MLTVMIFLNVSKMKKMPTKSALKKEGIKNGTL